MAQRRRVTDVSRGELYDQLVVAGVPAEIAGDVSADLGDMTKGLVKIQGLFTRVAEGDEVEDALDMIESECRDHLLGHLKSIRSTTKKLRRLRRELRPHGQAVGT
ncbi:MAG: hypothetical protein M1337_08140 [Actinobacteria bacterium]|nr:hypothetical protein [Actinomycetota bacterium]